MLHYLKHIINAEAAFPSTNILYHYLDQTTLLQMMDNQLKIFILNNGYKIVVIHYDLHSNDSNGNKKESLYGIVVTDDLNSNCIKWKLDGFMTTSLNLLILVSNSIIYHSHLEIVYYSKQKK